jgi:hydroxyacylglutathione hydrolase
MSTGEKHFGPVWFIPGENQGKYPYCHSVYVEGAGVVIDPASDRRRLEELLKHPGIQEVWLSHFHEDHFMHLDLFDDLPLLLSEADAPPLSSLQAFLDAYGLEDPHREPWEILLREQFHFRPRTPDRLLHPGETIDLGSTKVEVMNMPGHTPGTLCFYFREPRVLFMGDYDLTKFGPWYGDRDSSIEETIQSVNRLRSLPARVWIASHEKGLFERDPGELWDDFLQVIEYREERLLALLSEPRTMADIVEACIIYRKPREPKSFFQFGERALMGKHLERLLDQGTVLKEGEMYVKNL